MNTDSDLNLPNDLVQKYISRRVSDIKVCQSALIKQNFSLIQTLAHQMKGNGTSFGFPFISRIGAELELAAKEKNTFVIRKHLEELLKRIKKTI